MTGQPILSVNSLVKVFGGVQALFRVTFDVPRHGITALIGPNGAGKTTCINVISGVYSLTGGKIAFNGREITGQRPHHIAEIGMTRTFQNLQVFQNMTVLENVMVGLHVRTSTGFIASMIHSPKLRREERQTRDKAMEMLEFFGLSDKADWESSSLPYGDQKRIEMARALVSEPSLVLLDEPAAGLNTSETEEIAGLIREIRDKGVTVLLVEHDMDLVMGISDHVVVLNYGEMISSGTPAEVQADEKVIAAYLGDGGDACA